MGEVAGESHRCLAGLPFGAAALLRGEARTLIAGLGLTCNKFQPLRHRNGWARFVLCDGGLTRHATVVQPRPGTIKGSPGPDILPEPPRPSDNTMLLACPDLMTD